MNKFKVGDKVRIIMEETSDACNFSKRVIGEEFIIVEIVDHYCREFRGLTTGVHEDLLERVANKLPPLKSSPNNSGGHEMSHSSGFSLGTTDQNCILTVENVFKKHIFQNNSGLIAGTISVKEIIKPTGIKKVMNNIIEFSNNLKLSKEEKILRETGLHDKESNWTIKAIELGIELEVQELGYKNKLDMFNKIGLGITSNEVGGFSAIEIHNIFVKHEKKILEIATKMMIEEIKK